MGITSKDGICNSMSDLFHPAIPEGLFIQVARVMMEANWHTYQVLTKRSERLRNLLNGSLRFATQTQHIWWGVSVEDIKHGNLRIDDLRQTPALMKFLSMSHYLRYWGELDF